MVLTGSSNTEGALADAASSVRNVLGSSCHFLSMWFRTAMYCVGARARDGSSVSSSTVMPFQGSQIPRANGGKSTASLLPPPFRILLRLVGISAASSGTRGMASAGGAGVGSVCANPPSGEASPPPGGTIQCALSFLRGDAIARQRARQQASLLSPRPPRSLLLSPFPPKQPPTSRRYAPPRRQGSTLTKIPKPGKLQQQHQNYKFLGLRLAIFSPQQSGEGSHPSQHPRCCKESTSDHALRRAPCHGCCRGFFANWQP
jgi:hypothetical protein